MVASGQSPQFDKRTFLRDMNIFGRAYRNQAIELISICRLFSYSRAAEQILAQDPKLNEVLQACDNALAFATEAHLKTDSNLDLQIARAIRGLHDYEKLFRLHGDDNLKSVRERMEQAAKKDKEERTRFRLLLMFRKRTKDTPSKVVNFHLLTSITDPRPTITPQVFTNHPSLEEILWNFSRYPADSGKRITLTENPHFYHHHLLPITLPNAQPGGFTIEPMSCFQDAKDICVLTSKPSRVFFEFGQNSRAFDNFWRTNKIFVFKSICGNLESEHIIGALIQDRSCKWCHVGPRSENWEIVQDWRDAVHHVLCPQDIKIRITIVPGPNGTRLDDLHTA